MTATLCKSKLEAKTFPHLQGLDGIGAAQLEQHYKLYNGYVVNTNTLMEKIPTLTVGSPEWAELKRRLGFEINGVVLHELYFANMTPNGGTPSPSSKFVAKVSETYGSYDAWEADFKATGKMRGIGWAITYQCSCTGNLVNMWISDHENGHPAGFTPVLVMDVWEHAYTVDYTPTERPTYIDAFFKNINWSEVESRLA